MKLHPLLAFVHGGLTVSYCASADPQEIALRVSTTGDGPFNNGPATVDHIVRRIKLGAAAGREFSPADSSARIVSGPRTFRDADGQGPDYAWTLRVAGVCPLYLRNVVDHAKVMNGTTKSLSWVGSRPLDGGPSCATEREVRRWVVDPDAYPGARDPHGFRFVSDEAEGKVATVRLRLANEPDKKVRKAFFELLGYWVGEIGTYANRAGDGPGSAQLIPQISAAKTELIGRFDRFDYVRTPAAAVLANMLQLFHDKHAAIKDAQVLLPE